MNNIRIIDLFAGLGGIRLGFEQAALEKGYRVEVVLSSEIKPHAIKAYKENFNENSYCDITDLNEYSVPDFDFLLAGFPCQAFSNAGLRLGFEDTRGTLFFDVARIIKAKSPQGFLLENVEGLLTHDNGKTLNLMLSVLRSLGYSVNYTVLDGLNFGLAQSRKRIYIVGCKTDNNIFSEGFVKRHVTLKEIIESDISAVNTKFTQKLFKHFKLEQTIAETPHR